MQTTKPFERSFLNSTFAMAGLGVLASCLADPTAASAFMLASVVPLLLGSYYCAVVRGGPYLPARAASAIASAGFLVTLYFVMIWWSVLLPFLHFLSLIQCLRLWQRKTRREYAHLYLVSVVQVVSGSSISLDLQFGLFFLLFLLVGFWTLVLFYLRKESQEGAGVYLEGSGARDIGALRAREVREAFGHGLPVMFGLLFGGMVGLFLVLPRYHVTVLNVRTPMSGKALVGFSERTRLGEIGEIMDNPQPVMRVQLTRNAKAIRGEEFPLLWRGMSVDSYYAGEWRVTPFMTNFGLLWRNEQWITSRPGLLLGDGLAPPYDRVCPDLPNTKAPAPDEVRQEITLESTGTRVLFALYPTLYCLVPESSGGFDLDVLHWNLTFSLAFSRYYVAYSRPQVADEETLDRATLRWENLPSMTRLYFVLNPARDPRLVALATNILAEARATTPYQKVKAIRRWLERNCEYTLRPGVVSGTEEADPTMNFLFNTRKGHCEYFATAQVLLTRAMGIPARVVNGFRGGEWHDLGQFYLVRQSHAHSWAEVYLEGVKWFPVDPSPPESAAGALARPGTLENYLTFGQSLWDRFVIGYRPRQIGLASGLFGQSVYDLQAALSRPLRGGGLPGMMRGQEFMGKLAMGLALAIGGVVLTSLVLWMGRWRWPGFGFGRTRREEMTQVRFYGEMLRLLRRRGFKRDIASTPREFAESVVTLGGARYRGVRRVTEIYYVARFAGKGLTEAENREVRDLLREVRRAPRGS